MKTYWFTVVFVWLLISLAACQPLTQIAYVESGPAQPVANRATVAGERAMVVTDVQVQMGVGSPIPVDIFVSGTWPDLCAQLSEIRQRMDGFTIAVTILTTAADPNCPPDYLGLPFRIALPLNMVQLPEGEYTITVNDVSTTFTWPVPTALLRYEGPEEMGSSDPVKCASLELGADQQARLVACDGVTQTKQLGTQDASLWTEIEARFAPFVYETSTERLVFNGTGSMAGEAWQRALLAWARLKHAELTTGRVSASVATAMSWDLGQQLDQRNRCNRLTVLTFGYAYAQTIACEGGDVIDQSGNWLTTAELEPFDRWLYQRAAFNQGNNYIAGQGTTPLSAAERVVVQEWAAALYARLAPSAPPTPTPTRRALPTPTLTPTPPPIGVLPTDVEYVMALTNVNMRSGPGRNYGIIGNVFEGQIAQVTGVSTNQQWWRVICPDNRVGNCWLSADPAFTEPTTMPPTDPPTPPSRTTGEAIVESIDVQLLESFPVQANAILRGHMTDACTQIASYNQVWEGRTLRITMTTSRPAGVTCAQVLTPFEQVIPLNVFDLPAGEYNVRVNDLSATFTLAQDNSPQLPPTEPTDVQYVMAQSDLPIYAGPGVDHPVVGQVAGGMIAKVTGRSADSQWWRVVCPDETGNCWVSADPALTQPTTPP